MSTRTGIEAIAHERSTAEQRMVISVRRDPRDILGVMLVDGIKKPGKFIETGYGWLYLHTDGKWGYPGLMYGQHSIVVRRKGPDGIWRNVVGGIFVGKPRSTLGSVRFWPPELLLPHLWEAGFTTEQKLLEPFAIACGESGFWASARNWLPDDGFRAYETPVTVEGPAAAWGMVDGRRCQAHSDRGLFQFNSYWHPDLSDEMCDDPRLACQAVYRKSRGGAAYGIWGHGEGALSPLYTRFWDEPYGDYPALRPLVKKFLENPTGIS